MSEYPPPRIYCLTAASAPVVAVFRRGPTNWSHIGRWDVSNGTYEPGAWLAGRIFPRRSDISPDGRYLCYFAHKPSATWAHGESYVAVSRLPWLKALHAFGTCGTWSRGFYFTEDGTCDYAEDAEIPIRFGVRSIPVVQFSNERRRGWEESPESPARGKGDVWDQNRNARLQKMQPGGDLLLCIESVGWAGGEFGNEQAVDGLKVLYSVISGDEIEVLDGFQWADWDAEGRLLVATRSGKLQILETGEGIVKRILFEEDLTQLRPDPAAPPDWAARW